MRGETHRKARRCIHRRSIAARIAVKTTGAAAQGAGVRPRPRAPRRTRPEVPSAVTVGANAERTEAGGGELCRTRPRRRICIRRAGRRTHKSTALHREHGCPDRDRTLSGRHTPAQNISKNAKQVARCQANQHCKHTPEQNIIEPAKQMTLTGKHNAQTASTQQI